MRNTNNFGTPGCNIGLLERPRYFPRQLITPAEMTQEQDYFRQKQRLHNRLLHGWGVVCGALVCRVPATSANNGGNGGNGSTTGATPDVDNTINSIEPYKPWAVLVKRGYVLGPFGDDILINCEHEIDIRTHGLSAVSGESAEQALDPWCAEINVAREPGDYYIAVKYKECMTRPVRVQPLGCGCDETQCEYSRWRDGYEISVLKLDACPQSHSNPPNIDDMFNGELKPCPECATDPWVILAKITVDENGIVGEPDNCTCRRNVLVLGNFWWQCTQAVTEGIVIDGGESSKELAQESTHTLEIYGDWQAVQSGVDIQFDPSIDGPINVEPLELHRITVDITIGPNAQLGPRILAVVDIAGNNVKIFEEAIIVVAQQGGFGASETAAVIASAAPSEPVRKTLSRKTQKKRITKKKKH